MISVFGANVDRVYPGVLQSGKAVMSRSLSRTESKSKSSGHVSM